MKLIPSLISLACLIFATILQAQVVKQNGNSVSSVSGTLSVSNGGTGSTSLNQSGVLYGNGTSAISASTNATISPNGAFTVSGGSITSKGASDGTLAPAGYVGEISSVTVSGGAALGLFSSGSFSPISTITLTAGSWDISGTCMLDTGGTTAGTGVQCGISTAQTSLDGGTRDNDTTYLGYTLLANAGAYVSVGPRRVDISGSTTYYLLGKTIHTVVGGATWNVGSMIRATRVR